jgi:uncharacterized protein (DUF2235 family)
MVNLVVCCDGTWNDPTQKDNGVLAPTNVVKLYNAALDSDEQKRYYHPGVGVGNSWWDKAVGGGTGTGLSRNIMSAYRWLCENYEPGCAIYLFGFSRGAFTVRSLIGFMNCCGLLRTAQLGVDEVWPAIDKLYERGYRQRADIGLLREEIGESKFHNAAKKLIPVRFVGVWDTVGSLGIPDYFGLLNAVFDLRDNNFHDTRLGRNVRTARHALAMDEMRESFQPTLWTDVPEGADVKQQWFPGVHSDVGGGYQQCGLSDGALQWMLEEAKAAGLQVRHGVEAQIKPNALDILHDSCEGFFSMLPTQPRAVPSLLERRHFHPSALQRHEVPPLTQAPYRMPHRSADGRGIDIFARQQWNLTGIWLEAGKTYRFKARGQWLDASISCGPAGADDGHFQTGELAYAFGDLLGQVRRAFRKMTGNENADLKFTRRHEDVDWFCLTGAIANGRGVVGANAMPHEYFTIGDGCTYVPQEDGYLYAYANDAWNCYGNNKGSVELTVEEVGA